MAHLSELISCKAVTINKILVSAQKHTLHVTVSLLIIFFLWNRFSAGLNDKFINTWYFHYLTSILPCPNPILINNVSNEDLQIIMTDGCWCPCLCSILSVMPSKILPLWSSLSALLPNHHLPLSSVIWGLNWTPYQYSNYTWMPIDFTSIHHSLLVLLILYNLHFTKWFHWHCMHFNSSDEWDGILQL